MDEGLRHGRNYALVTGPSSEPVDLNAVKLHVRALGSGEDTWFRMAIAGARARAELLTARQLIHARYRLTLDRFPGSSFGLGFGYAYGDGAITHYTGLGHHGEIYLPHSPLVRVVSINYADTQGTQQTIASTDYVVNNSAVPGFINNAYSKYWPLSFWQADAVTITYDAGYASPITTSAGSPNIAVSGPVTWNVDDPVRFSNSGGALPSPLAVKTDYYVKSVASGVYTFAATTPTASASAITIDKVGTGLNFIGEVPESIVHWIMLQVESAYQIRGQDNVLDRGMTIASPPYADGLLDPYRVQWL